MNRAPEASEATVGALPANPNGRTATPRHVRLGLLGCGVVGGGLIQLINKNRHLIVERCGVDVVVQRVVVRDLEKPRAGSEAAIEGVEFTTEPDRVVAADDIDIVVEVMGGVEHARTQIERALRAGKHVVTANKALLAHAGRELFDLAAQMGRCIGFEASVCGGLPVINALRQGLVGNEIAMLSGIVNGTTNYILTRMCEEGLTLEQGIRQAQQRGFCEADPSMDIDGVDAAQKLVVLSQLAFGVRVQVEDIAVQSIRMISAIDIQQAKRLGYVIKHVASARRHGGGLALRVQPVLLPTVHPLANVRDEFNAVMLQGDAVGQMIFQGKGAGALPTASAVLADIVDVAQRERPDHVVQLGHTDLDRAQDLESRYYLRFPVRDEPGAIGAITTALGSAGISIVHAHAVLEPHRNADVGGHDGGPHDDVLTDPACRGDTSSGAGNVMIIAHQCRASAVESALRSVSERCLLRAPAVVLRIVD